MKRHRCEKSLLISYCIHRRRRFAFEVNGEHGSVQGWEDYSTHAGDAGVVTTTLWCRQLAHKSGGALLSIVDQQLVQFFGVWTVSYSPSSSRTISFAVLLALHRFYCFISNNLGYITVLVALCRSLCFFKQHRSYTGNNNSIIHTVMLSLSLTGRVVWPGGDWPVTEP